MKCGCARLFKSYQNICLMILIQGEVQKSNIHKLSNFKGWVVVVTTMHEHSGAIKRDSQCG